MNPEPPNHHEKSPFQPRNKPKNTLRFTVKTQNTKNASQNNHKQEQAETAKVRIDWS
jgi:hypothetical protein